MSVTLRSVCIAVCVLALAAAVRAQTVDVGTSASETASYGTASQGFGPFPWSELGITASASVTPGVLNVQTGGSTSFDLAPGTVTSGETFTPGTTVLDLGYTPGFKGSSISGAPAASGNLNSSFVWNLGPLGSGSETIVNATIPVVGLGTANLNSGLNNGIGAAALSQSTSTFPPVGLKLSASASVLGVTVASASISFDVQGQTTQNVIATPIVTYGDLVWESTTQTYSASDTFTFVPGAGGTIANTFMAPTGLSLTNGQTFYYNFLPVVEVNMPVFNSAEVSVPASITGSYDVFGSGGSETWPLGNLYSLTTDGGFDFNPDFLGSNFYSIPLIYESNPNCFAVAACPAIYEVGPDGSTTTTGGGTVPGGSGPDGCGGIVIGCNINVPGSTTSDGYSNTPPTLPPPVFNQTDPCEPVGVALPPGATCTTTLTQTPGTPAPEPNEVSLLAAGIVCLMIAARRKLYA